MGVWEDTNIVVDFYKSLIGQGMDSTIFYKANFAGLDYIKVYSGGLIEGFTFSADGNVNSAGIHGDPFDSLITIKNNKFIHLGYALYGSFGGTIINNIFEDNSWCGACLDIVRSFDTVIKNNTFINDSLYHLGLYGGKHIVMSNLFIGNGMHYMVTINLFSSNGDTALFANNILYNMDNRSLVHYAVAASDHLMAYNNDIIGTKNNQAQNYNGIYLGQHPNEGLRFYLKNNIIMNYFHGSEIVYSTDTFDVTYNDYWNNAYDYHTYGAAIDTTGMIHADPMLTDSYTFQLQMYSPLINAGDPTILDENGSRSDIGAWGGPYGHSYQYIDYPPQIPMDIHGLFSSDSIKLNWRFNTEADFNHYSLYRDTISGFTPSGLNLLAQPETSLYIDLNFEMNHTYYFKISATDDQNIVSDYSEELVVNVSNIAGNGDLPALSLLGIRNTYPNPFNLTTVIEYYLPDVGFQPAPVQVNIYDIQGRIVKLLVDSRQYPGYHETLWDGSNNDKKEVNSGVYFVRLLFSGIELTKPRKITLLR